MLRHKRSIPDTDETLREDDFDSLRYKVHAAIGRLEGPDGPEDVKGAIRMLYDASEMISSLAQQAERADVQVDRLRAYAEELQDETRDAREARTESEIVRDAIERSPHTPPGIWGECVQVARMGGDVARLLGGGR